MGIINVTSDRKNVTLDSDVILYILMNGKTAEIHIVGGKSIRDAYCFEKSGRLLEKEFVKIHRGCIVSVKAVHAVTDTVNLSNGEELLYTVRKKKQIVAEIQEKQKNMINALGKKGIPATEEEYCRHYSSFEYLPIAFTDIEMVFDEEKRAALYGEVLEIMDYSPEIDKNLKVICFPTFKGHCGCILFDLDTIKAVNSSNNAHKIWNIYLKNHTK